MISSSASVDNHSRRRIYSNHQLLARTHLYNEKVVPGCYFLNIDTRASKLFETNQPSTIASSLRYEPRWCHTVREHNIENFQVRTIFWDILDSDTQEQKYETQHTPIAANRPKRYKTEKSNPSKDESFKLETATQKARTSTLKKRLNWKATTILVTYITCNWK